MSFRGLRQKAQCKYSQHFNTPKVGEIPPDHTKIIVTFLYRNRRATGRRTSLRASCSGAHLIVVSWGYLGCAGNIIPYGSPLTNSFWRLWLQITKINLNWCPFAMSLSPCGRIPGYGPDCIEDAWPQYVAETEEDRISSYEPWPVDV